MRHNPKGQVAVAAGKSSDLVWTTSRTWRERARSITAAQNATAEATGMLPLAAGQPQAWLLAAIALRPYLKSWNWWSRLSFKARGDVSAWPDPRLCGYFASGANPPSEGAYSAASTPVSSCWRAHKPTGRSQSALSERTSRVAVRQSSSALNGAL